ncbi:N-acetylmuramoyl-L-alanine amidase [Marilutibacter chinensis]|uniref:Serine protease n=1 Tax=Marilutibacter chinensis TaxID=2912247 RepID=A0ABS9HRR1_9GAMM|nr:N-acetylmuramoyl-L-alanine amidase [Lysobacter chinensis]MCF7220879.1 N-acetylmuramoyl-L-alanine amidase [Lysobacter chinensis]
MAVIRANRESIDDRFSVLGFTVRTDLPLFEIGLATDPELLRPENSGLRTTHNFFSSRLLSSGGGGGRYAAGGRESVYLVPPGVVARFVGQSRLYFGLATYQDKDRSRPISVKVPDAGHMYVSLSGLTERGLRRTARNGLGDSNGHALTWGGDVLAPAQAGSGNGRGAAATNGGSGVRATAPDDTVPYSDGYPDDLWQQEGGSPTADAIGTINGNGNGHANGNGGSASNGNGASGNGRGSAAAIATPAPAVAQSLRGYSLSHRMRRPVARPSAGQAPVRSLKVVSSYYQPTGWWDALTTQAGFFLESAMWWLGVSDTTAPPHSAICQVRNSADGERGTAFFIGPRLLLTAAHVVRGQSELIIVPAKNASNEPAGRFRVRSSDWQMHPSYVVGNRDFDMALIHVPAANAASSGNYFDLVEELTQSRPEGVVVCGYAAYSDPADTVDQFVNETIDPNRQHMMGGHIRSLPTDETFDYDLQTLGGTSGSPVYWIEEGANPQAHMVGVHVAAHSETTNLGCRITPAKLDWIRSAAAGWGLTLSFALGRGARGRTRALGAGGEDEDSRHGIEGPIPDDVATAQALARRAHALNAPAPEYPQADRFVAAHGGNFRATSGGRTIERIVIHITDGGANINGTIGWFQNPDAKVSAHYVIGQDGEVVQMVRHDDVAWHARSANGTSIGIEHVANTRGLNPTPAQMCASAALVSWLCDQYGIPDDRTHILGHSEADTSTTHTGCPNAVWDWDYYMGMVTSRTCYEPDAAPAPTSQGLRARGGRRAYSRAQEIIAPFYDPSNPSTALQCTLDAFSQAREEWFAGVSDTRQFPHSAICQLIMTKADGSQYQGTGFYIGRNRILTCAHNLHGKATVQIIPGRNGTGGMPFGDATVDASSWRIAPGYTGPGDWDNDLAVIDDVPIEAPHGQFFRFLNASPSTQLPVVVCGYSAGSRKVPELDLIIDGDMQHLHGGYVSEAPTPDTIDYPILSLMGASGSPVYTVSGSGGDLQALICAVHVSGEPVDRGLNRGCFITPRKIDWIEGRATSFALDSGIRMRGRAPVRAQAPRARAQGAFDLLPVDLKLRVFIPSPAILMERPVVSDRAFGGDGRGFQHDGGGSRAEVAARLHFGDGETRARLDVIDRHWGESTEYAAGDTEAVAGKPSWYRNLKQGAHPSARETLATTDDNLSVQLGGSSHNGIISMAEGSIVVSFHVEGALPLVALSPDIDANLAVHVRVNGDRVEARVVGGHDEFPAYELYANGQRIYAYNPLDHGGTPLGLLGDGNWDVEVDSSYVDCGPASEYRIVGPVRIGSAAQALSQSLEIPLDPGIGGQSIGPDALAPGDIIVSTARHAVSYAIRAGTLSAISHAMIYAGDGNVIEAVGEGVREVPLATAIDGAILAVAYRDPRVDEGHAQAIVDFARAQVGQPYNYAGVARIGHRILFPFSSRVLDAIRDLAGVDDDTARSFYCSELVYAAFEAAGIALSTESGDPGTPDDLVRLRNGTLAYVGHLKARDELLGIALALSTQALRAPETPRMRVRALQDDGPSDYPVALIPQPDKNACWAASMAMLLSYRRNQSISPETLAQEVGTSLATSYGWDLLDDVRDRYGFTVIPQPSNASLYHSPREWARWLSLHGPLWVVIVGAPHAVVVAGIRGDLDDPAATEVKVLNPWDTRVAFDGDPVAFNPRNGGYEDWLPFADFAADYGNMAEPDYGNWRVLYLPATTATSHSLGARGAGRTPVSNQRGSGRLRLARPPSPVRALEGGNGTGNGNGAATSERIEPVEPSRVAGTRMHLLRGQDDNNTWALEQLEGLKAPTTAATSGSGEPTEVHMELGGWPALEGQPAPLPLTVSFRAAQGSVGDVRIAVATANGHPSGRVRDGTAPAQSLALDHGVDVVARIENADDVDGVAALKVGIDYRFVGLAEGSPLARIALRLLGDGRYERQNGWVTTA